MNAIFLAACLCLAPEDAASDSPPSPSNAALTVRIVGPKSAFVGQLVRLSLDITGDAREHEWYFASPEGKALPEYISNTDKTKMYLTVMEDGTYTFEVITVAADGKRGIVRNKLEIEFTYKNSERVALAKKAIGTPSIEDQFKAAVRKVNSPTKIRDLTDIVTALRSSRSVAEVRTNFTRIAGTRAPAWNSFFVDTDAIMATLRQQGLLEPVEGEVKDQRIVNTLQNAAAVLEAK